MFKHISNWLEAYFWFPAALLSVWLAAKFAYFLTERKPEENADFIIGYAQSTILAVLVIFLFSISREQLGFWMTKAECFAHPYLATLQAVTQMYTMGLFAYIYLH